MGGVRPEVHRSNGEAIHPRCSECGQEDGPQQKGRYGVGVDAGMFFCGSCWSRWQGGGRMPPNPTEFEKLNEELLAGFEEGGGSDGMRPPLEPYALVSTAFFA